jgi:putative oxidoreductase
MGITLQRLFSTFPTGWPGFALLMLRCSLGIALICAGVGALWANASPTVVLGQHLIAVVGGIFLLVGVWTPAIGSLLALDELWIALSIHVFSQDIWIHIFLAVVALSLAMLGPGAWSIDSRLFGRRRFDLDSRSKQPPSK